MQLRSAERVHQITSYLTLSDSPVTLRLPVTILRGPALGVFRLFSPTNLGVDILKSNVSGSFGHLSCITSIGFSEKQTDTQTDKRRCKPYPATAVGVGSDFSKDRSSISSVSMIITGAFHLRRSLAPIDRLRRSGAIDLSLA